MVQEPKYEINVNTLEHLATETLALNSIGVAELATDREIVLRPDAAEGSSLNKALGGFILIDKLTNATVACGMLHFALRRALNIHRQHLDVSRETHAHLKGQKPAVLWFTATFRRRASRPSPTWSRRSWRQRRRTFCSIATIFVTGSTATSVHRGRGRDRDIRRVGEVARLMVDTGLIVLRRRLTVRAERHMVRRMVPRASSSRFSSTRPWPRRRTPT